MPPILVAFGRQQIAIHADDAEVRGTLERDHRHMRGEVARAVDLELSIRREGDHFVGTDSFGAHATRPTARWAVRWARHRVLESLVRAHPELLWLHGAAVGIGAGAVIVVGPRGSGKSTLATALCAQGASYLSDDILPIDPSALMVHPFPRAPEVRIDPGEEMPAGRLLEVGKTEIGVDERLERRVLPIRAVIFPRAGRAGGVGRTPCPPSDAVVALAESCWNFADHGARAAHAISRLASAVPVSRLAFDDAGGAAAAVSSWLEE